MEPLLVLVIASYCAELNAEHHTAAQSQGAERFGCLWKNSHSGSVSPDLDYMVETFL